ncbi:MAG: thiamine-binding protein [Actinobacteria bacterium]|nr:thiamine-binding protein [Actinomycetota bacterium]
MPVAPSEMTATFTISPSDADHMTRHVKAAVDEARASGLAMEAGPEATTLAGGRAEVLDTLTKVIDIAIGAGATGIEVKIEAATESI